MSQSAASVNVNTTLPAEHGFAITPSDTVELDHLTREIRVGGAGDIVLVLGSGDELTIESVAAGERFAYRVKQVKSTGTTATKITGVW